MAIDDELDLATTDQLISALGRRCDLLAVVGTVDKTSQTGEMIVCLNGSKLALSKLLDMTASAMVEDAYCAIVDELSED